MQKTLLRRTRSGLRQQLILIESKRRNKKQEDQKAPEVEKVPVMKDGKYACANKGCKTRYFSEDENSDIACQYHSGEPIFHDLMKGWS